MSLTRDNHFVPQVYLRNFANGSGEVMEYRTLVSHDSVEIWKAVNVAGTGYTRDLYTRIVQGEQKDDIEQWLNSEFESPAKSTFEKVLEDKDLDRHDWTILVRFLACQIVRTPAFLVKNLSLWNQMTPAILEQTMRDVEEKLHAAKASGQMIVVNKSPHTEYFPMRVERNDIPEERKAQITTKILVGRGMWFYSMKHLLTNTLEVLHRHNWGILEAPSGLEWFTSDDPVVLLNYRSELDYDFNGGWNRKNGYIILPLSPRHLMFTQIGSPALSRHVLQRYRARILRRLIAQHAHRRIYSLAEDEKVPKLRSRVVDYAVFNSERALWEAWYEDQSRAEAAL